MIFFKKINAPVREVVEYMEKCGIFLKKEINAFVTVYTVETDIFHLEVRESGWGDYSVTLCCKQGNKCLLNKAEQKFLIRNVLRICEHETTQREDVVARESIMKELDVKSINV